MWTCGVTSQGRRGSRREEKTGGGEENAEWKGALHSGGYNMLSFIVQNGQIIQLCCELQTPPLQHLI